MFTQEHILVSALAFGTGFMQGCCGPRCQLGLDDQLFAGGGEDAVLVDMPFESGYSALCTQGTEDWPSHHAISTTFDVDLDTPNDADVPVFAPAGGFAHVFDTNPDDDFGLHINLDLDDGTYVIIAHLAEVFIDDQSEVAAGQLLGYEGTTGNSSGDHVHFGRHSGDASLDGIYGESFDGLIVNLEDDGLHRQLMTSEMWCGLPGGDTYTSLLATPLWHPNGSLIKTPNDPTVYLVELGNLTPFLTEDAFLSRNYDFADVALISDSELNCYGLNIGLSDMTEISAVYGAAPNQAVWLLVGSLADSERYRLLVPSLGWQAVLKSWGIIASTYDDLYHEPADGGTVDEYSYAGTANFRDGSLVSMVSDSAVYVMSDGLAMPIETWDGLLLAGWEDRVIIEVNDNEFEAIVTAQGDCATSTYCLTQTDLQTCGGFDQSQDEVLPSTTFTEPELPTLGDLKLTWYTPSAQMVDSITLVGAVTPQGEIENPWGTVFNEVLNQSLVSVTVPGLATGDSLRFSVEFRDNGIPSWSCLAPFPPGLVQGSVTLEYAGLYLGYTTADDPMSNGCGLTVLVP